jgi:hypothetical protein
LHRVLTEQRKENCLKKQCRCLLKKSQKFAMNDRKPPLPLRSLASSRYNERTATRKPAPGRLKAEKAFNQHRRLKL